MEQPKKALITPWNTNTPTNHILVEALRQPKWLTKPWTAPDKFNGELIVNIRSPRWFPITHKFYTEQGSEYIRAKDGSTRRIKAHHSNADDIWLKDRMDKAIFTKNDEWYYFNLAVQLLLENKYKIKICRTNENRNIAIIYICDEGKWRQAYISDAYPESIKNNVLTNWPLKAGYSSIPKIGSIILEFKNNESGLITKAHPWSKVSHIE